MTSPLIEAEELLERVRSGRAPVIVDARWQLGAHDGHERYLGGHIPGALFVDLETDLADPPSPQRGRHPLPSRERFQALLRRLGVDAGDDVVVYDQAHGVSAARMWWMLRNAGIPTARVLDGGLRAWGEAGGRLEGGEGTLPDDGTIEIDWDRMPQLTIDDAAAFPEHGVLLDARAPERYRGEQEPVDPRAGHIPGALSSPTAGNLDENARFLGSDRLVTRFDAIGATDDAEIGVYCGSGVTAAHVVLALELAGRRGALFPGSWSQWSNDPERPVATGAV
ncbi:sulfurtransferase [Schumannella luteola]|uniref:Thiosulfate/3-mercaptopyruvate sulfurtransferase n=1 Tax=Schumannella luteola TaxID=472059 RepID=A0A852Y9F5_9MICO|nr:sulfurtransferase [Schumannella luteola]NYG99596.1 thiosulfate/3-mercaptopyruvate sulfurtransferase [Schumannella luteola]TPX01999.1 sulfurtransferase [Schumannella luteola]